MKFTKSIKRWTPFKTEKDFQSWLETRLKDCGCVVTREPTFMASAATMGTPHGKNAPRLDLHVVVPPQSNSLGKHLELVIEVKNKDNYGALRDAHNQIKGAMCGFDWYGRGKHPFCIGSRPWRGLVITPGQLDRSQFQESVSEWEKAQDAYTTTKPWSGDMWGHIERDLWTVGAALLWQLGNGSFLFSAHVGTDLREVIIGPQTTIK
jgi:hypothetical protein